MQESFDVTASDRKVYNNNNARAREQRCVLRLECAV